ncbi:MAG: hypothetical protein GY795_48065 [Desulfobacterales bacterium]|nr:hypothetical protein [Desulfobacterales bacterium]
MDITDIERRICRLEEIETVKRFMARWARWLDRCELTCKDEDFRFLVNELMTPDGYFDTVFGKWTDKEEIVANSLEFSKDISWAVHYYFHQEVNVDLDANTAHFHAMEMVPLKWHAKGTWLLLENDSDLKKVDGQWKMHKYGLEESKILSNTREDWPDIPENPKARMFKNP